ncbi:hypothetical protein N6H18_14940 [Reichenbachiella agarivorans]|uniref:Uncharacterized protein n=1 Tax=Reichenbachiella agarivorans TaxID=2979464 RepID=A0ABY6CQC6_9BACT|nr:hypothetical protein [Reichenbachiella agarivorans]UXP31643.1 hypothetical protein N6H18_14940 [Reichenbachiella agarivorans]
MSKNTYIDIEDKLDLPDSGSMTASMTIGNGQTGGHSVFLGSSLLGQGNEVTVGEVSNLHGQMLIVTCTVVDTNPNTNWTSFKVTISCDQQELKTFGPYSKKVDKDKDIVSYTLIIDLI